MILSIVWDFDPILLNLFGIKVAYYGLLWVMALWFGSWILKRILKHEGLNEKMEVSAFFYFAVGAIVGARLGHCLFYDPVHYLTHPIEFFYFRQGGLASHGAAIGMVVGMLLFSRKWNMPYLWIFDRSALLVPLGGAMVRLGNFFNSEIYGGPTDLPWGVVFVRDGQTVACHPTQIYEALCYIAIFALMYYLYYHTAIVKRAGLMFGWFMVLLFGSRFFVEMVKNVQESWEQELPINMGQILSIPFVILGIVYIIRASRRR